MMVNRRDRFWIILSNKFQWRVGCSIPERTFFVIIYWKFSNLSIPKKKIKFAYKSVANQLLKGEEVQLWSEAQCIWTVLTISWINVFMLTRSCKMFFCHMLMYYWLSDWIFQVILFGFSFFNFKFYLKADDDPKHTSKRIKNFTRDQSWTSMDWPAQSPDLNPIEMMGIDIDGKIKKAKLKNNE